MPVIDQGVEILDQRVSLPLSAFRGQDDMALAAANLHVESVILDMVFDDFFYDFQMLGKPLPGSGRTHKHTDILLREHSYIMARQP